MSNCTERGSLLFYNSWHEYLYWNGGILEYRNVGIPAYVDTPPADEMGIHAFGGLRFVVAGRDKARPSLTLFQYSIIPLFPLHRYSAASS
jgi:hypothetical protein